MNFSKEIMKVANSLKIANTSDDGMYLIEFDGKKGIAQIVVRESTDVYFSEQEMNKIMSVVSKRLDNLYLNLHNLMKEYNIYGDTKENNNKYFIAKHPLFDFVVVRAIKVSLDYSDCANPEEFNKYFKKL